MRCVRSVNRCMVFSASPFVTIAHLHRLQKGHRCCGSDQAICLDMSSAETIKHDWPARLSIGGANIQRICESRAGGIQIHGRHRVPSRSPTLQDRGRSRKISQDGGAQNQIYVSGRQLFCPNSLRRFLATSVKVSSERKMTAVMPFLDRIHSSLCEPFFGQFFVGQCFWEDIFGCNILCSFLSFVFAFVFYLVAFEKFTRLFLCL